MAFDAALLEDILELAKNDTRIKFLFEVCGYKTRGLRTLSKKYPNLIVKTFPKEITHHMSELTYDCHLIITSPLAYGAVYSTKLGFAAYTGLPVVAWVPKRSEMHRIIKEQQIGFSGYSEDSNECFKSLIQALEIRTSNTVLWEEISRNSKRFDKTSCPVGERYLEIIDSLILR